MAEKKFEERRLRDVAYSPKTMQKSFKQTSLSRQIFHRFFELRRLQFYLKNVD